MKSCGTSGCTVCDRRPPMPASSFTGFGSVPLDEIMDAEWDRKSRLRHEKDVLDRRDERKAADDVQRKEVKPMNFGEAIQALKSGKCVRRVGWNDKGMHIYLEDGHMFPVRHGAGRGIDRKYDPCIFMFTAQKTHQPGWLASQADMLADDWETVLADDWETVTP